METGSTYYIYKNKLDKAYFPHDMAQGKSKDLVKRSQSEKLLKYKAFKIANDRNYDRYQRGLALMAYKFFNRKSSGNGVVAEPNYQLANELHRRLLGNFKQEKSFHLLETLFGVMIQVICN